MTEKISIGVAVLTYRRPELLKEALLSLQQQTITASSLHILVIDNDPALSGQAAFQSMQHDGGVAMRYCAESVPGLAAARNRALLELQSMDFIAFLDDDEAAAPNWLEELLRVQRHYSADVVCGPVEPRFHQPPQWILRGNFFAARRMPTGSDLLHVGAGNVLFRASLGRTIRFDPSFSHSGGEDTHFFLSLRRAGHSFVWAYEAVAYESIPPERMTGRWLIRRAHSDAYRLTRSLLLLEPGWRTSTARLTAAAGQSGTGLHRASSGRYSAKIALSSPAAHRPVRRHDQRSYEPAAYLLRHSRR